MAAAAEVEAHSRPLGPLLCESTAQGKQSRSQRLTQERMKPASMEQWITSHHKERPQSCPSLRMRQEASVACLSIFESGIITGRQQQELGRAAAGEGSINEISAPLARFGSASAAASATRFGASSPVGCDSAVSCRVSSRVATAACARFATAANEFASGCMWPRRRSATSVVSRSLVGETCATSCAAPSWPMTRPEATQAVKIVCERRCGKRRVRERRSGKQGRGHSGCESRYTRGPGGGAGKLLEEGRPRAKGAEGGARGALKARLEARTEAKVACRARRPLHRAPRIELRPLGAQAAALVDRVGILPGRFEAQEAVEHLRRAMIARPGCVVVKHRAWYVVASGCGGDATTTTCTCTCVAVVGRLALPEDFRSHE